MTIIIHLDMDNTIADFISEYAFFSNQINMPIVGAMNDPTNNNELFKLAVLNHRIFSKLKPMPLAYSFREKLIDLEDKHNLQIEILSSLNSTDEEICASGREQKIQWLNEHGFNWKANFVNSCEQKAFYATPYSILLDDSLRCTEPYAKSGGNSLLFTSFNECFIVELEQLVESLIAKKLKIA